MQADKEGNIVIASPSAARMYHYESSQEMIGVSALKFYKNPEDRDHVIEVLRKHGNVEGNEIRVLRKDGASFLAYQNAQFLYENNGQIIDQNPLLLTLMNAQKLKIR